MATQNLYHSGTARALTLDVNLDIPASGDVLIYVKGNASSLGWQPIPNGQKQVVTVGRGTQYEAKYLVSSITFSSTQSTLRVLQADRGYDGIPPTNTPAGAAVEHTISASEMASVNDYLQSVSDTRPNPVGAIMMWSAAVLPAGWLLCDGSTFSAVTYPKLNQVLGGTKLPNLVDSYVKGGATPALTPVGSNQTGLTVANLPAHNHGGGAAVVSGGQSAGHTHAFSGTAASAGSHGHGAVAWTDWQGEHSHNIKSNGGASQGPNNTSYYETNDGYYVGGVIEAAGAHGHNVEVSVAADGAHTHAVSGSTGAVSGDHTHTVQVTIPSQGSGTAFVNEPRHVTLRYIICAEGI